MDRTSRSNSVASFILFAVVGLAPLPFGSTDASTVAIWCMTLGIAALFASPRGLGKGQFALLGCAAVLITAYAIVIWEQLSPHPWLSVAIPDPVWRKASDALGTPLQASVSIARNQPFFALGASLAAMLSMICSFVVCADRHRAQQLIKMVAWSGVGYAGFAIVSFAIDPTRILWREKQAYLTVLTGTFINRNTAAVYFGSCAIIWLLLLTQKIREHVPGGSIQRSVMKLASSGMPRDVAVSFLMFFVCLASMFMTGSRAGIVLSLMAIILAVIARFYRDLPHGRSLLTAVLVGLLVSLVLLQTLGAGVSGRFDTQGLADEGRFEAYRSTWRMITDHPWLGTGLGTFAWGFPAYRSQVVSVWGVWDRAHNSLLEIAAELGLPLAGLVVAGWIVVLTLLVRGIMVRRRSRLLPIAGLAVAILALLHSLIDFSLQIPGYAIVIFAVVGAGLAQSFPGNPPREGKKIASRIETSG